RLRGGAEQHRRRLTPRPTPDSQGPGTASSSGGPGSCFFRYVRYPRNFSPQPPRNARGGRCASHSNFTASPQRRANRASYCPVQHRPDARDGRPPTGDEGGRVFPPNSPGGPGNPGGDGTPGNHHPGADPRSSATGARVSRRRALQIGGAVGLTGLLAACGSGSGGAGSGQDAGTGPGSDSGTGPGTSSVTGDDAEARLAGMLDQAPRCPMTREETQGPYWFDVDDIRSDVRE